MFAVAAAHGEFWLAAALLVVHWLGDSLDGTLARVRRAERPRYGYYLDHLADAVATALDRPRPRPLRPHAPVDRPRARDRLPGPLDQLLPGDAGARALLARLRAARADRGADRPDRRYWPWSAPASTLTFRGLELLDLVALVAAAVMGVAFVVRAFGNLRVLAAREPYTAP